MPCRAPAGGTQAHKHTHTHTRARTQMAAPRTSQPWLDPEYTYIRMRKHPPGNCQPTWLRWAAMPFASRWQSEACEYSVLMAAMSAGQVRLARLAGPQRATKQRAPSERGRPADTAGPPGPCDGRDERSWVGPGGFVWLTTSGRAVRGSLLSSSRPPVTARRGTRGSTQIQRGNGMACRPDPE